MMPTKKAIVLVSGGLDSATVAAIARDEGYEVYALSFDYGQRHRLELDAARAVVAAQGIRHHAVSVIDLRVFGGSALTSDIAVPKHDNVAEIGGGIPITYVPARNTIFLSFALAYAEVVGANDVFIGVNALDYSGYPDCRPEYFEAFNRLIELGTRPETHLAIYTPLIHLDKGGIVRLGLELGAPFELTWSCYQDEIHACGRCSSCRLRLKGFAAAGVPDPISYRL